MKKIKTQMISFLLCLLMIMGSIYELPMTSLAVSPNQPDVSAIPVSDNSLTDSDTEEELPSQDIGSDNSSNPADTPVQDSVTITFFDTDGSTILLSVPMKKGEGLWSHLSSVNQITPVKNGYKLYRWHRLDNNKQYKPQYLFDSSYVFKKQLQYKAVWDTDPYIYDITYVTDGGQILPDASGSYPENFTVESKAITLPAAQRSGCLFDGWYKDAAFTTPVAAIPQGTYIDSDANGNIAPYTLYAKWIDIKPLKMETPTAQNTATGKIKVSFTRLEDVDGYEITYSTQKKLKKNTLTKTLAATKSSYTLTNLPAGKTYYFKIRAFKTDSTGKKSYGEYSDICSCKVTTGVKEFPAKAGSGKLKDVSVKSTTDLYVKATVPKRLKSSDDFYYLVKVNPDTGKVLKQISKTDKTKSVIFQIPLRDEDGNNHIQGKFGIAIKKGKKYVLITSTSYIRNPEDAAGYTGAFPTPVTKKGRQGCYNYDIVNNQIIQNDYGEKHYFTNFFINTIIGTKSSHSVAYKYNGKTYYFNEPREYYPIVSKVNQDGGTVTIQIMLKYDNNCKDLILKSGRTPGAHYYAFNTEQKAAREKIEAAFCFLAETFSRENCHVDNWIIGNEVNTYANPTAKWYYAGQISKDKFMNNYASTFRMLYYAVRSNSKNSRVYICCDHTWINREQDWGTKYFTEAFNRKIKSQNENISWNLAYHAYSAVLTNADFWNDGKLAPNNENANFVSPNNLEILTKYIKKKFGEDVRIILSEQGFSYSGGVGSPYNRGRQTGEDVQAAAMAWLYYKAQFNDMIDAVIFSAGDHGGAGYQFDIKGKKAENVYKYMDTPQYASYTRDCLKTIGKPSWSKAVKGFKAGNLKKMPNR